MADWIEVGKVEDIPRLGARVVKTDDAEIAVFRTADDEIFALLDHCPHKGGPLSQGMVHGCRVTCPLHNRVVELSDGQVVAPDTGCVQMYPVRVQEGLVFLSL